MSLVAILAALRARKTANAAQPAKTTLPSGLGVEARADGAWLLWRSGVQPSDREVEVIARDAKITEGYSVMGGPSKALDGKVYRLLTPLGEDMDGSEYLCKACRSRSLADDVDGGGTYCPKCGFGTEAHRTVPVAPPPEADAMPAPRADLRPGTRLETDKPWTVNTLYHFEAYGVLWTVIARREPIGETPHLETILRWAALEPVDGPHGDYQEGSQDAFEDWMKLHGQVSPLEPPARWRGGV